MQLGGVPGRTTPPPAPSLWPGHVRIAKKEQTVIKGLTVLELNDLVKACEEEFGVSAAAGVVVAAAGAYATA